MKSWVQIALVVVVSAAGGAVALRMVQHSSPSPAVAPAPAAVPQTSTTAPSEPAAAPQAASAPAASTAAQSKPSPVRERTASMAAARNPEDMAVPKPEPQPAAQPVPQSPPIVNTQATSPVVQQPPPPPAPPEPPPLNKVTLAAGQTIHVRLIDALSSERNKAGDQFTGTLAQPLTVDGFVIAERGAHVEGRVVSSDRGGKVKGVAELAVELTRVHLSDGQWVAVSTEAVSKRAETGRREDAAKVGGGAAIGAIIGAIAGGGKGAAIGAGVGGGAGAGDVLLTRGKPAAFPTESALAFRLRNSVTVTERRR